MDYSTYNITISIFKQLATKFRSFGYDVYWFSSGDTEAQTAGGAAKGTITLVPHMPDPAFIIRRNGTPAANEVPVPAFTVSVGARKLIQRLGFGDSEAEWERTVVIGGFAEDEIQQMAFSDLLEGWIEGRLTTLSVWNYDSNESTPSALDTVFVEWAKSTPMEIPHEVPTIRYLVRTEFGIRYAE